LFLGVFLYAVGFIGGFLVPTQLDGPLQGSLSVAIAINLLLLSVFAVQHSLMARPGFKQWWMRFVPAPIERSTYVLFTNLALILLFWQWRPMGGLIWEIEQPVVRIMMWAVYGFGWLTVLATTCLINHFDLFGLRQVWLYFRGRPYTHLSFVTPGPYRLVRHPLYVGWLTVFWATPTMTWAHLLFALGTTAYILLAIQFEERDLVRYHGPRYESYRRSVPMLIPRLIAAKRP
jgi:protein-S-isoprenylcysteine O-methyltransferase Ste14